MQIHIMRLLPHPPHPWGIFPHKTRKLLHISEKATVYHPQKQKIAKRLIILDFQYPVFLVRFNAWLLSFGEKKLSYGKTVLNKEMTVHEWQQKVKHVMKELKILDKTF